MQTPEQVKWDIFERCVKKDTVDGKDKSRTGNVEHFGSPAECVSHFLNLLRGHKHSKSCKCENTWEIEGDKLVFKKVCRKKLQANMKSIRYMNQADTLCSCQQQCKLRSTWDTHKHNSPCKTPAWS